YSVKPKVKFATLDALKQTDDLKQKMKIAINGKDKAGDFYRQFFFGVFQYISNRIPEIADEIYRVDDALNAGFGWELGPFAAWDALGLDVIASPVPLEAGSSGRSNPQPLAKWVTEMIAKGNKSFYIIENGKKKFYDQQSS